MLLIPTLPTLSTKYSRALGSNLESVLDPIPRLSDGWAVIESNSSDLPTGWELHVTPEGDSYWNDTERKVISHADPGKIGVATLLNKAYEKIRNEINDWENVEIFLNTCQDSHATLDSGAVQYYVVNHGARRIFWIEDVKVDKIGIGPVGSPAELRSALLPEYWRHVDSFPCHRAVDEAAREELLDVLRHGAVDDMSAPGSTFPYSAKECLRYLSVIEGFKRESDNATRCGYKTASVARIWGSISRVRHINGHGLKHPRLDRLQGLDDYCSTQSRPSLKLRIAELLCFNLPRRLHATIAALWNGRIVYQRHWHSFFEELRKDWERLALINIAILIALIHLNWPQTNNSSYSMALTSVPVAGLLSSILLHQVHRSPHLLTASDISAYISYAESYRHGLRGLSVVLSLPRALTYWGILLLQATLTTDAITEDGERNAWIIMSMSTTVPILVVLSTLSFFRSPVESKTPEAYLPKSLQN